MESTVKTAVSLPKALFARAEELAREMQISRSRLIALALQEYLRREEQRRLTERLDAAYGAGPDEEEAAWLRAGAHLIAENDAEGQW